MSTLEKIIDLKRKGVPESGIITQLKNEGISPMEINDALNQSKIKEAVSGETTEPTQGMMPSMMGDEEEEESKSYSPNNNYAPSPQTENYAPSEQGYSQEDYSNYSGQSPNSYQYSDYDQDEGDEYYEEAPDYSSQNYGMNSETMIEVAEQVFSEKVKKIEEELKSLKEFKTVSAPLLKDLEERVRRIERNFDKMQIAILEKVGSFGKEIDSVKKEVEMVEDSFEKMNHDKK